VAQTDEGQHLTLTIYREVFAAKVRHTHEQKSPGAAAAHFCFAINESRRRAEALLHDLDAER
jgi:hypothetical protein